MNFSGIIYSVAWSPDGDKLAVATDKNGVQVWDLIRNCIEHKFYEVSFVSASFDYLITDF